MTACYNDKRVKPVIGDIRNLDTLGHILQQVDTVIHLAAMKHIDLCEKNVAEAINTNVFATMDLLNMFEGRTFISMSTDKVVEAIGCYGATKLLLEKLTLEKAQRVSGSRFMIVRSGNIFGSTGSVIHKWIQQIKLNNKIVATDLQMTRFFIDAYSLVDFIIDVVEKGENGKIYIPNQVAIRLDCLIKAIIDTYGNTDTGIDVIGPREGEKIHERLFFQSEKNIVTKLKSETSDECHKHNNGSDYESTRLWLKDYVG
jgi:FlaA1/EpsC-like NDP-sugar epimerase